MNYAHDGEKETDMRLLQVIPIAGNLPVEEGHSREAHGLNVSTRLGPLRGEARHRMCPVVLLLHILPILKLLFRRIAARITWRNVCRQEPICVNPVPMQSHCGRREGKRK